MSKFKKGNYVVIRKDIPLYCEIVNGRPCKSYYSLKKWIKYAGALGVVTDVFARNNSSYYAIRDPIKNMDIGYFHEKQLNRITTDQLSTLITRKAYELIKHDNSVRDALHRLTSETSDYKRIIGIANATRSALHAVDQGKSANKHFKKIESLATNSACLSKRLVNWLIRDCRMTLVCAWSSLAFVALAILTGSAECFWASLFFMLAIIFI